MGKLRPEAIGAIAGIVLFLGYQLSKLAAYEGEYYIGTAGLSGVIFGSLIMGLLGAGVVWGVLRLGGVKPGETRQSRCMRCNKPTQGDAALCSECLGR